MPELQRKERGRTVVKKRSPWAATKQQLEELLAENKRLKSERTGMNYVLIELFRNEPCTYIGPFSDADKAYDFADARKASKDRITLHGYSWKVLPILRP